MIRLRAIYVLSAGALFVSGTLLAQDSATAPPDAGTAQAQAESPAPIAPPDKRAFGVLANYRTAEESGPWSPITTRQKFTIARKDTLDGPSYILAAFFSGISQLNNTNPSFGQGLKGFGRRYVSSIADQDIGNYLTEAILPTAFHQDPRYFRRGHGSVMGRIAYAASRSAIAKNDSGQWTFNAAEFLGNGMVASLGNAYYPDERGFKPTMQRMFTQIGTDSLSQVLKEFWPDVKRHFLQKHAAS
jgi:hypothetical protein